MNRLTSTLWIVLSMSSSLFAANVAEIPPIGEFERSGLYRVAFDGRPMTVQRCDGRGGPASYVHVVLTGRAKCAVRCAEPAGRWSVSAARQLPVETDKRGVSFVVDAPGYVLVRCREHDEKLFIFVEGPDRYAPAGDAKNVVKVTDRGIAPNTHRLLTGQIQAAIDEMATREDGGTLVFGPGTYRTGTIRIKSNVTVYLSAGARLQGSDNPADYPFDPGTKESPDRTQDIRSRLILFDNAENAALVGLGEVDGSGHVIRGEHRRVPNLIRVRNSRDIRIEGVLLRRAAGWNTHIFHSDRVTVRNLKLMSNWSDGLDADNSRDVTVADSLLESYDDSFVVKATGFAGHAEAVRGITLRDSVVCTVKSAIKIGTETLASVMEDITVENVTVASGRGGLVIFLRDGADIRKLTYRDVRIDEAGMAIEWSIRERAGLGRIENVLVEDLHVAHAVGSVLKGHSEAYPIADVRFVNMQLAGKPVRSIEQARFEIEHVRDITFE